MTAKPRDAHYACALILRDGKALLGRRASFRGSYPNCWDFIGGRIEEGEEPQDALRRELAEEIAISPHAMIHFADISDIHISPDHPPVYHFYRVTDWDGGEPVINNHEHTDLAWFTLRQACDLSNLALHEYRDLLRDALVG